MIVESFSKGENRPGADIGRNRKPSFAERTRSPYHEQEIDGLPAPVQRHFRTVLRAGQPIVTGVTVQHTGTFNVTAFGNRETWMPFTSDQSVLTHRPGFVWSARMPLLPGIAIFVHDAYVAGVGTLHPALLGLFSLTHQHGTDDIARGELMRYMMEAVWYPTALLPSQGTTWVAIDEESANATMVDGDISMTMRFSFDATGLIDKVDAEARGALIGGNDALARSSVELPGARGYARPFDR